MSLDAFVQYIVSHQNMMESGEHSWRIENYYAQHPGRIRLSRNHQTYRNVAISDEQGISLCRFSFVQVAEVPKLVRICRADKVRWQKDCLLRACEWICSDSKFGPPARLGVTQVRWKWNEINKKYRLTILYQNYDAQARMLAGLHTETEILYASRERSALLFPKDPAAPA